MKKLIALFLALTLLVVPVLAAETFTANITITTDTDSITVVVADSDALAIRKPDLTVACAFATASVTRQSDSAVVFSTLDTANGKITFQVVQGDTYVITPKEKTPTVMPEEDEDDDTPTTPTTPSKPSKPTTPAAPAPSFTDVKKSDYFYAAVHWAVKNGVTTGTSTTTFSPALVCDRAQMVTFLWKAAGSPKATGANPFTDVNKGDYYYDAVLWAVANGITNGTGATTFSPAMAVTRAQVATILWRYTGSQKTAAANPFTDVTSGAYYYDAVLWAAATGITTGTTATTFSPDAACTRAQIVTFLYRAL